jgi:hypothetical protein
LEVAHYPSTVHGGFGLFGCMANLYLFGMIQNTLTLLAVTAAVVYLVVSQYRHYIQSKKKCTGCAVHKIYVSSKKN